VYSGLLLMEATDVFNYSAFVERQNTGSTQGNFVQAVNGPPESVPLPLGLR